MKRKWKENERKDEVSGSKKKREWKKEQQTTETKKCSDKGKEIYKFTFKASSRKEQKKDQNR